MPQKPKILVIVGPTSSGKSGLAVKLAKKYEGEIVSADSRQIYKGLDIATNKINPEEMQGAPHHMLDVWNPKKRVSVSQYKKEAEKKINEIISRDKLAILAGGTGFYIDAVVYGMEFPEVPPNEKLRHTLEKESVDKLLERLKMLDLERFESVDRKNKRRVIRAIEIAKALGRVPEVSEKPGYHSLLVGLSVPKEEFESKIKQSVKERIRKGMIQEAKELHEKGLSWKRMRELGLEYKLLADYHQGKIKDKKELVEKIVQEDLKYAKRQMTWFRRYKEVSWFSPNQVAQVNKKVRKFLDG